MLDALRDGEIDVALIVAPEDGAAPQGVRIEPLFSSSIRLMVPPGVFDEDVETVDLSEIAERPMVTLQPGSSFRTHLERAFARRKIPFRPAVEVGNLSLVRRFVVTGLGLAPVPEVAFSSRARPTRYSLVELKGIEPVGYAYAVRGGAPLPPLVEALLDRLTRYTKG